MEMAKADAMGKDEALQCSTVLSSVCRQPVAETELIADSWDLFVRERVHSPFLLLSIKCLMREGFGDKTMRRYLAQND